MGAVTITACHHLLADLMESRNTYDGKTTAEVHDYVDERTGVLASSLAKRAPGYVGLGFPDPRRLPYTPSAKAANTT